MPKVRVGIAFFMNIIDWNTMNLEKFQLLGLSDDALKALDKKGFEEPTPIQEKVIPLLLNGDKDIIGQAQTGTGKTAAFGLPLFEKIAASEKNVKAIILTPTRELAIQVAEELASFKGRKKLKILPVYGGQSMEMQLRSLRQGVHIVVGTPGRVIDHLKRKTLKLHDLDYCILDEADEMLNMGFLDDIEKILEYSNEDKRTLLFSATMPDEIRKVAETYMREYDHIKIKAQQLTIEQTEQIYFQVSEKDKFEALCRIIDIEDEFYGLIFCRTKNDSDKISHRLLDRGYDAEALHGDLSQVQREKVMNKFKKKWVNILVATDVAARGIDVNNLTHVINYALPQDPEAYVHRIGRTGRAGKEGTAITFITPDEEKKLLFIERKTKSTIRKVKLPGVKEIIANKRERIVSDIRTIAELDALEDYTDLAQRILKKDDPQKIIAAMLKYSFEEELDPGNYNEIRDVQPVIPGQTRLFIAKGRKHGMTPKKLITFVQKGVNIQPKKIKDILIQDDFSFINVPFKEAELILHHFKGVNHKKPIVVMAKPKGKKRK
jgi:ATP-dependent RNA helicase DeaD